ncbi:hypothetical protein D3C75_388660 [compost metagenome]
MNTSNLEIDFPVIQLPNFLPVINPVQFCEYTSWRKESIERIITSKLRTAVLRLTLDNQLEQAILSHHQETNKQMLNAISTLETEIEFLRKKTTDVQTDINSGRVKPFYKDLLEEMKNEASG